MSRRFASPARPRPSPPSPNTAGASEAGAGTRCRPKRLLGNGPAATPAVYAWRLLFDRDTGSGRTGRDGVPIGLDMTGTLGSAILVHAGPGVAWPAFRPRRGAA